MRGLFAFFAIAYLALARGAAIGEEGKTICKNYNIEKGELINALTPFWQDDMMLYAVCEGSGPEKNCKIYLDSTDQNTVLSCDLNLKYTGRFDENIILTNAGHFTAVLAVRDGESRIKLISVKLKGCQVHETSIDVSKESLQNVHNYYASSVVVAHENNYDLFYRNQQLCGDWLCKATIDYEGKVVKAASRFPVKVVGTNFHQIEYGNNAYLVAQIDHQTPNVYLVKNDEKQTKTTLFTGTRDVPHFIGLSTEEGKFGLCATADQKVICKQYDLDGKTKKIELEIPEIDSTQRIIQYLDVLNLEKGLLALSVGRRDKNSAPNIVVAHFDEQGKKGKTANIDPKCQAGNLVIANLYRNTNGQYCVDSICMPTFETPNRSSFSRTAKCLLSSELL